MRRWRWFWLCLLAIGNSHADTLPVCYYYGCKREARFEVGADDKQRLARLMANGATAEAEREAVKAAVQQLFLMAGKSTPIWQDKGRNFPDGGAEGHDPGEKDDHPPVDAAGPFLPGEYVAPLVAARRRETHGHRHEQRRHDETKLIADEGGDFGRRGEPCEVRHEPQAECHGEPHERTPFGDQAQVQYNGMYSIDR